MAEQQEEFNPLKVSGQNLLKLGRLNQAELVRQQLVEPDQIKDQVSLIWISGSLKTKLQFTINQLVANYYL